jgi:hypothetical protein
MPSCVRRESETFAAARFSPEPGCALVRSRCNGVRGACTTSFSGHVEQTSCLFVLSERGRSSMPGLTLIVLSRKRVGERAVGASSL